MFHPAADQLSMCHPQITMQRIFHGFSMLKMPWQQLVTTGYTIQIQIPGKNGPQISMVKIFGRLKLLQHRPSTLPISQSRESIACRWGHRTAYTSSTSFRSLLQRCDSYRSHFATERDFGTIGRTGNLEKHEHGRNECVCVWFFGLVDMWSRKFFDQKNIWPLLCVKYIPWRDSQPLKEDKERKVLRIQRKIM